jgi:hypothetical protein
MRIEFREVCKYLAMRTVLDIPDSKFTRLAAKAEHEGTSVIEIVLRGIDKELESAPQTAKLVKRLELPLIRSSRPGSLATDNETIYDLIDFP